MTTSTTTASALEQGNLTQQTIGRPVVYGTQGVISSGHYLTSMAGMRMLLTGGNAFDAVVAAGFAAAVTEPIASYSLAAEGVFMLYHAGKRRSAVAERAGNSAGQGDGRMVPRARAERDSDGPRSVGASQLHRAGRGGGVPVAAGAVRNEDGRRGS